MALTSDAIRSAPAAEWIVGARDAGFDAVGLGNRAVDDHTHGQLAAAELSCHELMALTVTDDEQKTLRNAGRLAELAFDIGAEWVMAGFAMTPDDTSAALVRRCCDLIVDAGARLAVEFSIRGYVGSISDGLRVVNLAGGPQRAGLVIDTWHFFRGPSTWDQLETVPLGHIAYVQFDDAVAAISTDVGDETMNRRVFPGDGELPLRQFADTLLNRGWDGTVSVEVLNQAARTVPIPDYARHAYESSAPYWL